MDFYKRVPKDLTEATSLGAFFSICAVSTMIVLFFSETLAFANTKIETKISVDKNTAAQIRLNFNITLVDLQCDYVSVDVWDALGTNRQNVTKNINKWLLDSDGVRRVYGGKNRETRELEHEEHEQTLEEMHEADGVHVEEITEENFESFIKEHDMVFLDWFAPWCVWCQRLAPTWEKMAVEIKKQNLPVAVGKVDCVAHALLCRNQRIMAFPTLRWYHAGEYIAPDYKMDRTVDALISYVQRKLEMDEKYKKWLEKDNNKERYTETEEEKEQRKLQRKDPRPEHPGCQVSGHLLVNRVPGNFHIEAKSKNHALNAAMTNLTHVVNHLSFGDDFDTNGRTQRRILKFVPVEHQKFAPMDGQLYSTPEYHQAFHHYIKVVSTHLKMGDTQTYKLLAYQFIESSQVVQYSETDIPEARFSYDLSPMSVVVQREGRKWYDYVTSLCAIVGGAFTTVGLIDATLYRILKPKKL